MLEYLSPVGPDGPSTPFGAGVLVLDLLRCLIFGFVLVVLVASVASVTQARTLAQAVRITANVLMVLVIAGTEASHLGDAGHWRLPMSLMATGLAAWGMLAFLRYETPGAGQRQEDRDARRAEARRLDERARLRER